MSGESPREENRVETSCGSRGADPDHCSACGVAVTAPATPPMQVSRQQLIVWWLFGQQGSREGAVCETPAVRQSVPIEGEIPANATTDPCKPMASITMIAMSWRFISKSLTATAVRSKSCVSVKFKIAITGKLRTICCCRRRERSYGMTRTSTGATLYVHKKMDGF
jgi:hypothetical protein